MANSQGRGSLPRKLSKARNARMYASWTASSASSRLCKIQYAKLYASFRCASTTSSKRDRDTMGTPPRTGPNLAGTGSVAVELFDWEVGRSFHHHGKRTDCRRAYQGAAPGG